jgi:toxin-antitoxin system, antitoxin component, xre family
MPSAKNTENTIGRNRTCQEVSKRLFNKKSAKGGNKMTLTEALNEQMKDESFKKEYEALDPEYEIISSLIDARKSCNITQKQLAETTGIAQSDISKIENRSGNPTIGHIYPPLP